MVHRILSREGRTCIYVSPKGEHQNQLNVRVSEVNVPPKISIDKSKGVSKEEGM